MKTPLVAVSKETIAPIYSRIWPGDFSRGQRKNKLEIGIAVAADRRLRSRIDDDFRAGNKLWLDR